MTSAEIPGLVLLSRSVVPVETDYKRYKQFLRNDFYYSCAYCTMSEGEAQTIRFTIDHYVPKSLDAALECEYTNLMYCCDECNMLKGTLFPSHEQVQAGERFFRPDWDDYATHFSSNFDSNKGQILNGETLVGEFTVEFLDLNRYSLRKLRTIRAELSECSRFVAHGVFQLRHFPIDQLPKHMRSKALQAIDSCEEMVEAMATAVDDVLRGFAHSFLADEDPDIAQSRKNRKQSLKALKTMQPGLWRNGGRG